MNWKRQFYYWRDKEYQAQYGHYVELTTAKLSKIAKQEIEVLLRDHALTTAFVNKALPGKIEFYHTPHTTDPKISFYGWKSMFTLCGRSLWQSLKYICLENGYRSMFRGKNERV